MAQGHSARKYQTEIPFLPNLEMENKHMVDSRPAWRGLATRGREVPAWLNANVLCFYHGEDYCQASPYDTLIMVTFNFIQAYFQLFQSSWEW